MKLQDAIELGGLLDLLLMDGCFPQEDWIRQDEVRGEIRKLVDRIEQQASGVCEKDKGPQRRTLFSVTTEKTSTFTRAILAYTVAEAIKKAGELGRVTEVSPIFEGGDDKAMARWKSLTREARETLAHQARPQYNPSDMQAAAQSSDAQGPAQSGMSGSAAAGRLDANANPSSRQYREEHDKAASAAWDRLRASGSVRLRGD